jgi:excisionase family DNA binding protein
LVYKFLLSQAKPENFALCCLFLPVKPAYSMENSQEVAAIMTIKEVSDYLKVTERTIYRLAAGKQIPAFKVGGSWRFSRSEIDQWIKSQSSMPMEQADD